MTLCPFQILGVSPDADDDQIRRAYLQKVRRHPPERDPEMFRLLQQAYESIRDVRARIDHKLFHVTERQVLLAMVSTSRRPSREQFQAMLRACAEQMMTEDDQ